MAYIVPNMTLIPQEKTNSCWYASAQMLIRWRGDQTQSSEMGFLDPSLDPESVQMLDDNNVIYNPNIVAFAKRIGLRAIPPLSPTEDLLEYWLRRYGPLWVNGISHIVVIAGIWEGNVLVYDPSPIRIGRRDWRSLDSWYTGNSSSSRDAGPGVETVFLYCP